MSEPLVSIIIPVYNTEKYLERCINSIMEQTFKDYELLLIDDGSTDRSSSICDDYADKFENIRVIHKTNGGVSSARNTGIIEAEGKYIYFADSDDIVKPDGLESLVRCAEECKESQLVVAEYEYIFPNGNICYEQVSTNFRYEGFQILNRVADFPWVYWATLCNKLYRADIIHKYNLHCHKNITIEEDLIFNFEYLKYVRYMVTSDIIVYSYCGNITSSTHKSHSFYSYMTKLKRMSAIFEDFEKCEALDKIKARYFINDLKIIKSMYFENVSYSDRICAIHLLKDNTINKFLSISKIEGLSNKIKYTILKVLPIRFVDIIFRFIVNIKK